MRRIVHPACWAGVAVVRVRLDWLWFLFRASLARAPSALLNLLHFSSLPLSHSWHSCEVRAWPASTIPPVTVGSGLRSSYHAHHAHCRSCRTCSLLHIDLVLIGSCVAENSSSCVLGWRGGGTCSAGVAVVRAVLLQHQKKNKSRWNPHGADPKDLLME